MKRVLGIIVILFFLAGCSSVTLKDEKKIMTTIEETTPKAYKRGEDIYIEVSNEKELYRLKGSLFGETTKVEDYQYSFEYLEILEDTKEEIDGTDIKVLDSDLWDRANIKALESILPKEINKGLLLLSYYYEAVIFRNSKGEIEVVDIINIPDGVEVVGKLDNNQLAKLTLTLLETIDANAKENRREFLFVTRSQGNYNQPFTYVNLDKMEIIYYFIPSKAAARNPDYISFVFNNTVGLINNPFTVTSRFVYWLINSGYVMTVLPIREYSGEILDYSQGPGMDLEEFEDYLDRMASSNSYKGSVEYLIDGEEYFLSLIASIYGAKESINIRTYIFDNDDYAVKIADMLKQQSEDVKVKVLMDELGSVTAAQTLPGTSMPVDFEMPQRIDKYLKEDSKVSARTAKNPWFTTDHVKTLIFDNQEAYIGGMNIGREYRYEWHDIMLKVEGPIVGKLSKDFYAAWGHAGLGGDLTYAMSMLFRSDDNKMEEKEEYIDIRPLYTKTGKTEIHAATIEAIKRSKNYIYIQNAYFSDNKIINELIRARARGVDVRIILPYWGNHNIMNSSNMVTANTLVRNGIKVYLYPGMTHVKATVIDGWAMVGTANYDKLSMRVNQEVNLAFSDKETVDILLERLFEEDFAISMEVQGEFPIPWYNHIFEKIADQL